MNIIIIAQNKTFRESLKTTLEQIPDFEVVFATDNFYSIENPGQYKIQLILIDFSIGKEMCVNILTEALCRWQLIRFLFMINYKEEIPPNCNGLADVIKKNAGKQEFENKIRELINDEKVVG